MTPDEEADAMRRSAEQELGAPIEWREEQDAMQPEYDFSGGERGKHTTEYAPPARWKHGKLHLKPRRAASEDGSERLADESPFADPVDALVPTDFPPEADAYNPFNYTYEMFVPELNMTLWVHFRLEGDLDLAAPREPINFTRNGVSYSYPFFPPENRGKEPGEGYDGEIYDFYREGERRLFMVPEIEKAVIHTPGKEPANVTKELVAEYVTPDKLMDAIHAFRDQVRNDERAPQGLRMLLSDMTQHPEDISAWDMRDDSDEDEDEDDEWDDEDDYDEDEDGEEYA